MAQGSYKKLLIIDDDIEDHEIFEEAIHDIDDTILCYSAMSGDEALDMLEKDLTVLPDLIFLDLNMPKLNGKQVLREIKSRESLRPIPVIMYSTSFAPHDIEEVTGLGAAFHLLKPSKFEDLVKALTVVLSKDWSWPREGRRLG